MEELVCKEESYTTTNHNLLENHFKSMEIINRISSDNNEDNNISTQIKRNENKTENFLKKLIKRDKKANGLNKKKSEIIKNIKLENTQNKDFITNEMMIMYDNATPEIDDSQKPLPHIKKSLSQDIKNHKMTDIEKFNETISLTATTINTTVLPSTITTSSLSPKMEKKIESTEYLMHPQHFLPIKNTIDSTTTITTASDELLKHSITTKDSQFIPPMLLVKSHYMSTKSHFDKQNIIEITTNKIDVSTEKLELITKDIPIIKSNENNEFTSSSILDTSINQENTLKTTISPSILISDEIKSSNVDNAPTFSTTTMIGNKQLMKINKNQNVIDNNNLSTSTSTTTEKIYTTKKIRNKFSNEENFQPYKPNRKRILTKPETPTYLKKILG